MNGSGTGFDPGDEVRIIDGTFASYTGRVVTPEEARDIFKENSSKESSWISRQGYVWVVISIFGRPVPVSLEHCQLECIESH